MEPSADIIVDGLLVSINTRITRLQVSTRVNLPGHCSTFSVREQKARSLGGNSVAILTILQNLMISGCTCCDFLGIPEYLSFRFYSHSQNDESTGSRFAIGL